MLGLGNRIGRWGRNGRTRETIKISPPFEVTPLERRVMLAAQVTAAIPARIDLDGVEQLLFASGTSLFTTHSATSGVTAGYVRFATDAAAAHTATFDIAPSAAGSPADAALALYDGDGNRLAFADADAVAGTPGVERLSGDLQPGRTYVLGTFTTPRLGASHGYDVGATLGPQTTNVPIRLNPATGTAARSAGAGEDAFSSPRDVDFYPLDFVNGREPATVSVSGSEPDVRLAATLWRLDPQLGPLAAALPGDMAWVVVDSGASDSIQLAPSPQAGGGLTDGRYVLAVAPLGFDSPARSYRIDVAAQTLAPASVAAFPVAADFGTPGLVSPGVAGRSADGTLAAGGSAVYRFRAPATGPLTLSVDSAAFPAILALYDNGGAAVHSVRSRTAPGRIELRLEGARAGEEYAAYVAPADARAGAYTFSVNQPYAPQPLSLAGGSATVSAVPVGGAAGGRYFRVAIPAGADVLSWTADNLGAAGVVVVQVFDHAADALSSHQAAAPGESLEGFLDAGRLGREVEFFVTASGAQTAVTLALHAVDAPDTLPLASTPLSQLNLASGDLSFTREAGGVGSVAATKFYAINTGAPTALVATPTGSARAALALYSEADGVLRRERLVLPGPDGTGRLSADVPVERFAAVAAVTVRPAPGATVRVSVDGSPPRGTGIAMAPEPVPKLSPNDPEPPAPRPGEPPFSFNLRIRGVQLSSAGQRDLWETLLPANPVAGAPVLRLGPAADAGGGSLALHLTVLDGANNALASVTTAPGQVLRQPLAALGMPANQGRRVRFLVESVEGQPLGDGLYTLALQVETADPRPYQVWEPSFSLDIRESRPGIPAGEPMRHIAAADVPVSSEFTSSAPYDSGPLGDTGSFDLFFFWWDETPFEVQTELLDPSSGLNTNMKLYRVRNSSPSFSEAFDEVPGIGPSLDYFPADRSQVDARIVVNNVDLIRETFAPPQYAFRQNQWWVVVKNEQGTTGRYRVRVRALPPQVGGPASTPAQYVRPHRFDIDPVSGQAPPLENYDRVTPLHVGMPTRVSGPAVVRFEPHVAFNRRFSLRVEDDAGQTVYASGTVQTTGAAEFSVPGLQPGRGYFLKPSINGGIFEPAGMRVGVSVPLAPAPFRATVGESITYLGSYQSPAEPYYRARQGPDGNFDQFSLSNIGGLQQKLVFWVSSPGPARFTADLVNLGFTAFSLYRGTVVGSGEFSFIGGRLVDYVASAPEVPRLSIDSYVYPGMYFLTVVGFLGQSPVPAATVLVNGDTPDAFSQVVTLDPNAGSIAAQNLRLVDDERFSAVDPYRAESEGLLEGFRTSFYRVEAPGAVRSGLRATAQIPRPPGNVHDGNAWFDVFKQDGPGSYTRAPSDANDTHLNLDGAPDTSASVTTPDLARPGDVYYLALSRDRMYTRYRGNRNVHLTAQFDVPQSATPDLVVEPVRLEPANGRTRVSVTLRNHGYATVNAFRSGLRFSNYPAGSSFTIPGMAPFTEETFSFLWDPTDTGDRATYTADPGNAVEERNELNNEKSAALTSRRPSVSLAFDDPSLDGNPDPNVMGRFVADVLGLTYRLTADPADPDGENDVYETYLNIPGYGRYAYGGGGVHRTGPLDFGDANPTGPDNPNFLTWSSKDRWGLRSAEGSIRYDVVPRPKFYTDVRWNPATRLFELKWIHDIIRYDKTVSEIVGTSLPIIGDKKNRFIIGLSAQGTASLRATDPVSLPLAAELELTAFDKEFFKESWSGTKQVTDHFYTRTSLEVSPRTLDVTAAAASFQLRNLELLNLRTPKIPLFSFGLPGVAEVSANFSFGLRADLDAGIKFGINPAILVDPLNAPMRIGLMSPTFVRPSMTGTAYLSGDVRVLGFDIASIEGNVGLTLNVTVGLDNGDRSAVLPFSDLVDRLAVKVDGSLNFGMSASVAIIGEVWSFSDSIPFEVADTSRYGGIITTELGIDPAAGGAAPAGLDAGMAALGDLLSGQVPARLLAGGAAGGPSVRRGSDRLGAYAPSGRPQLVIDPLTGRAITVQVVDLDPGPDRTVAGLAYATRSGGVWSNLSALSGPRDVANPLLALTRGGDAAAPAMLLYEAVQLPGDVEDQPLALRLASRRLRYRHWDGSAWGPEIPFPHLGGADSDAAVAFNAAGAGVAAWVDNDADVPLGEDGTYARSAQDIHVSRWDAANRVWLAPAALTSDAVADSQPAVFVDDAGKTYVVWVRDLAGGGNELVFSIHDGGGWSEPRPLPTTGLEPGGQFTSVALGSERAGRVNALFNYRRRLPDGSSDSRLYNRPAAANAFGASASVEIVAERANFSHLRTTNAPDGSLVATWQQSDGETNEVYAAVLRPPVGGRAFAWSEPARLTSSPAVERHPAVAVEPDGTFQVLYELGGTAPASPPAEGGVSVAGAATGVPTTSGIGGISASALGDFAFLDPLAFDDQARTTVGQAVGRATVINRGRAASDVTIQYLFGPAGRETVLASEVVRLSPGATYRASHAFNVFPGSNRFAVRLLLAGGEIGGAADNITVKTLAGVADIELVSLAPDDPSRAPGPNNPLRATVRNRGNSFVPSFDVGFYAGDPLFPTAAPRLLDLVFVGGLAGGETIALTVDASDVSAAGDYVFAAVADAGGVVDEVSDGNNYAAYRFRRSTDPRIRPDAAGTPLVTAELLNHSGVDNARVTAVVENAGDVTAPPTDVVLLRSLDGGEWVEAGRLAAPALAPGASWPAAFTTVAFAGENRYRVVVNPPGQTDRDPGNNVGEARLTVTGLAELGVPAAPVVSQLTPRQGWPLTVTGTIVNSGIASAENVLVEVLARPAAGGAAVTLGSTRLPRVGPMTSATFSVTVQVAGISGGHDLFVVVDGAGDTLETDETNNQSPTVRINVRPPLSSAVVGRHLFYNNSAADGRNAGPGAGDDDAIDAEKQALLPGGAGGLASVSSFWRGINGVMIDIADLPPDAVLTAADFSFKVGNGGDPLAWGDAPPPLSITRRNGAGVGGSDRLTLIWADGAVSNTWLRVAVLPTAATGLAGVDASFWGNLIGETGNGLAGASGFTVDFRDVIATRNAIARARGATAVRYDFNRDGRVTPVDFAIVRRAQGRGLLSLAPPATPPQLQPGDDVFARETGMTNQLLGESDTE